MTSEASRKALIIAHEPDGPAGMVGERLEQQGFVLHTHVVADDYEQPNSAHPFPDPSDFDLLVLMGSIRSLTKRDEIDSWIDDELALISAAHDRGQPTLGVCFGGQLLAEALGGKVESAPEGEFGWHNIEPVNDDFGSNVWATGPWMQWHHDRFHAPTDADLLATSAEGDQLFLLGRSVGTQFHPEVDHHHLSEWMDTVDDEYLASVNMDRDVVMAETADREAAARDRCYAFVDWFLSQVGLAQVGLADDTANTSADADTAA